ncbi:MAG: DUF1353 domain-containing protein [Gammaproteobacteria bacterium]|nr:DUF1353 domain-containing protein [Gammaproteobacteria bacterium]
MSRFTEQLIVTPCPDGRTWIVLCDFGYEIGAKGSSDIINVPIGFHTDFASVPRLLWAFLPRWGKYGNAAVIHDYLYWEQTRSRKESDDILLEGMIVLQVSYLKRYSIYWAVRLAGWWAWCKNQSRKTVPH